MRSMSRGSQTGNSSGLASTRTNWYWVRLTVVSMLRSWTGCMNSETPPTAATSRRRRRMTSLAVAARSSRGLRLIRKRPVLSVGVGAVDPDERREAHHVGVFQDPRREGLLQLGHARERHRLRGLRDALDQPGVLHREEALGDEDAEEDGEREGRHRHREGVRLVLEDPPERPVVGADEPVEGT